MLQPEHLSLTYSVVHVNRERVLNTLCYLVVPDLDRLLNTAPQAPFFGGGCVIPISIPYKCDNVKIETFKTDSIDFMNRC